MVPWQSTICQPYPLEPGHRDDADLVKYVSRCFSILSTHSLYLYTCTLASRLRTGRHVLEANNVADDISWASLCTLLPLSPYDKYLQ